MEDSGVGKEKRTKEKKRGGEGAPGARLTTVKLNFNVNMVQADSSRPISPRRMSFVERSCHAGRGNATDSHKKRACK